MFLSLTVGTLAVFFKALQIKIPIEKVELLTWQTNTTTLSINAGSMCNLPYSIMLG